MKRKIVYGFLMMALSVSTMGSFVSCKDYDEDRYVDLKDRIAKEGSLREILDAQVQALKDALNDMEGCKCNLKDYLTKEEAANNYATVAALNTAIGLLQNSIDDIYAKLSNMNGNIATQVNDLTTLIIKVQKTAEEALRLAQENGCTCDLSPLENRIATLEGYKEIWDQRITQATETAASALTKAESNYTLILENRKLIDSLFAIYAKIDPNQTNPWTIGDDGYWYLNGEPTQFKAVGIDGAPGTEWTIGLDGYWYKDGEKTNFLSFGKDGSMGPAGPAGPSGLRGDDGKDGKEWKLDPVTHHWYSSADGGKTWKDEGSADYQVWKPNATTNTWWLYTYTYNPDTNDYDETDAEDSHVSCKGDKGDTGSTGNSGYFIFENDTWKIWDPTLNGGQGGYKDADAPWSNDVGQYSWIEPTADGKWVAHTYTYDKDTKKYVESTDTLDWATCTCGFDPDAFTALQEKVEHLDTIFVSKKELQAALDTIKSCVCDLDSTKNYLINNFFTTQEWSQIFTSNEYITKEIADELFGTEGFKDSLTQYFMTQYVTNIFQMDGFKDSLTNFTSMYFSTENNQFTTVVNNILSTDEFKDLLSNYLTTEYKTYISENLYTKEEVNNILKTYVTSEFLTQNYYTKTDLYTKQEVTNLLNNYVTNQYLTQNYYTKEDVINLINQEVSKTQRQLDALASDVAGIHEILDNTINSITIQATENPVFGYLNLPLDTRSTVLFAYFGQASGGGFWFPTDADANYENKKEVFTPEEMELMGISDFEEVEGYIDQDGGIFINEDEGNSGKVYFSLNPNEVSISGKQFALVNSRGQEGPVKISGVKKSDKLLTFGYDRTRGNVVTMYEANATLNKADVLNAYIDIPQGELVSQAKDLLKSVKTKSATTILDAGATFAKTAIETVDNTLPVYGLQASWNDSKGESHTAVSQMNMAASAIKPLSFTTLHPLRNKSFYYGMDRIQDLVAEMINQIKIKIHVPHLDLDNVTFDAVMIDPVDAGTFKITVSVQASIATASGSLVIEGQDVKDSTTGDIIGHFDDTTGTVTITNVDIPLKFYVNGEGGGDHFEIDYTDEINDLISDMNGGIAEISDQLADIFNQVKEFNRMQEFIDQGIDDMKQNMIRGLNRYITKAYRKLNALINGRGYLLFDICLVGHQNNNFALISQSKKLPTKVSGTVTLLPTSYTLELFAPAYKKFIAVTHVYNADRTDAANMKSLIRSANTGDNMMKVIDGDRNVEITGQAGYIYEISYAAVDYRGQMTRKKFYVQFK